MKAYVLIIDDNKTAHMLTGLQVRVLWSNTQCAEVIIAEANKRLTDGSHADSLGVALRALDNLGVDVQTIPVDCEPPVIGQAEGVATTCRCGVGLDETQTKLSMARRDGALPACKDCVTLELTQEQAHEGVFDAAVDAFLGSIRALIGAHYTKNFPRLTVPTISVDPGGQKYLRIVSDNGTQRSVYCFVDKASGDILKADGWKRPAKHARGSIYDNAGKGAITPYGVHYITSRGHKN